ncbi:MAG: hypothetical protein M1820_006286 [Bogoriella megaspora]|nr:MAG: hypothetical protein M1820_006286 [Bogoriella megaspora]
MFNNTTAGSHTSRNSTPLGPNDEPQYPRGECRYIRSATTYDGGGRERCPCQSFWLREDVPGSMCECGHQAWAHILDTPADAVSLQEHSVLIDKVKQLEANLEKERQQREEDLKGFHRAIQGVYGNLALLSSQVGTRFVGMDDKIEGVMDQMHACQGGLQSLQDKVVVVDDATMDLETRLDNLQTGQPPTGSVSPITGAIKTLEKAPPSWQEVTGDPSWKVTIALMPRSHGQPFASDSVAHRRCLSRRLERALLIANDTSSAFVAAVDDAFLKLLGNRSWIPLVPFRTSLRASPRSSALRGLPADKCSPELWDKQFLEEYCILRNKQLGDYLHIALQSGELSWQEIKKLPKDHSVDQSCWEYDPELDGSSTSPRQLVTPPEHPGIEVDDSCSLTSLPPYSSRAPSEAGHNPPSIIPLNTSPLQRREEASDRDFDASEDEQTLKKICLRPKSESPTSQKVALPQTQYISGRTKRKVAVREKQNQPGNKFSDWKSPVQTFLQHHHLGKEKESDVDRNQPFTLTDS